jgi:hypothetical protein
VDGDEAAERIRKLIIVGDNRLKQGGPAGQRRAREAFERALALADQAGMRERFEPFIARRLADIDGPGDAVP